MNALKRKLKKVYELASYVQYYIYKPVLPVISNKIPEIVVSFTTYPARVWCLPMVVGSILRQKLLPDVIVIYLSKQQFDDLKHPTIQKIQKQGVRVVLVDGDLRSHKKYYYAMHEYPNSIIITVDDDVIYDKNTIYDLYESYKRHPKAVSAKRVHGMKFDESGQLLPYRQWEYQKRDIVDTESLSLIPTGCGGVLYPPCSLNEKWNDMKGILATCLYADDLWLKIMSLLNKTPVVLAKSDNYRLHNVWSTLTEGLASENVLEDRNDEQMKKICEYLDIDVFELVYKN